MSFRVAFIGAGSIGFTRKLLGDLLSVPEFRDMEVAFTDIHPENLRMVTELCQRDIDANGLSIRIVSSLDRREVLRGAKYVFCVARIGGLEAFQNDVEIPLRYGVDQCVGDTLGPGGILYGQRGIPAILDFCRDIREVAAPGAILFNYSNPMAMLTWAANQYGGVHTVGLCHGVQHGHMQLTRVIERWARKQGIIAEDAVLKREEVDIVAAGLNHQTWFIQAQWRGMDFIPRLLELFEDHPEYSRTEKVRIDVLRRFGYYSTESNGHLSEYLPWYRKRLDEIKQWIDLSDWIHGETGGYLRVCSERRRWFETDFPNWLREPPHVYAAENRSEEHGSHIIEGLETGRIYRGHFNVRNRGIITNLPEDAIVEVPGYVDRTGIQTPLIGELPLGCAAICSASVSVQRLAVEAAVRGDDVLLRQALLMDPLTGAVANPLEVWQLVDEMLVAEAHWLPQYTQSIEKAKARLGENPPQRRYSEHTGAARVTSQVASG